MIFSKPQLPFTERGTDLSLHFQPFCHFFKCVSCHLVFFIHFLLLFLFSFHMHRSFTMPREIEKGTDFDFLKSLIFCFSLILQLPVVVVCTKLWKNSLTFFPSTYLHLHSFLCLFVSKKETSSFVSFSFSATRDPSGDKAGRS